MGIPHIHGFDIELIFRVSLSNIFLLRFLFRSPISLYLLYTENRGKTKCRSRTHERTLI